MLPDPATPSGRVEPPAPDRLHPLQRVVAALEVLICSDYPTQFALGATFAALGYRPFGPRGQLAVGYVTTLSLVDTALLIGLILFFLYAHDERPRDVFVGRRPFARELVAGIPLALVALGIGVLVLSAIARVAPSLHNVPHNPLQDLIRTRRDAVLFSVVVVAAGGVREEIQRAFLLRRFEGYLGGGGFGVVVTSIAFGAGHLVQGVDAAVATGTLGAFWGVVYLRRRSIGATVVSHAGFDLLQIAQFVVTGR